MVLSRSLFLFEIEPVQAAGQSPGGKSEIRFEFYTPSSAKVRFRVQEEGKTIDDFTVDSIPGLNIYRWDAAGLEAKGKKIGPGTYRVIARSARTKIERTLKIAE